MTRKLPLSLLFFLIAISFSFAQGMLDSLLQIDQSEDSPRTNVFTNMNLSREYYILGEYQQGFSYGQKGVGIAKKMNNDTLIGQAYFYVALNGFEIAPDTGFNYYIKSIDLLLPLEHNWTAFALNNLCTEYTEMSWYSEALEYRLKSLDFFEKKNDTLMTIHSMVRIGFIHDRIGEYDEALGWYNRAEKIAIAWDDLSGITEVYAYRGIAYDELEMYDSAHYYNQIAIANFKEMGDFDAYGIWCSNIGNTYLKQKNYKKAEEFLIKALESSENIENKAIKQINLSKVYYYYEEYDKGDSLLHEAIDISTIYSQYKFLSEAYFTLSESLQKRNQSEKSLDYYKKYKAYEDTVFNQEKSNQIAYHNTKFKTQEKEKELLVHKNKNQKLMNEKLQLDLELAERNVWVLFLGAVIIVGSFLAILLFLRKRRILEKEKNEALLEEKNKGIQSVITAQENERSRIARELHDGIVQELTYVKSQLKNLASSNNVINHTEIDQIAVEIDRSAQEVRNISHELMPYALKELGLVAALDDMFEKVLKANNIGFDFSVIGIEDRLPSTIEVTLYRIAQELVNNVIKHSQATELEILLSARNQQITLRIEDNGIGMTSKLDGGIGLQSIKSRLDLINGVFKFEKENQQGLVAIIQIPLN